MPHNYLIFGGTFDPVTFAHEKLIRHLQEEFNYDQIIIIPNRDPVPSSSKKPRASAEQRFEMLKLVFPETEPQFLVSRIEIDSPHESYTIDTLGQLGSQGIITKEDTITLLIGADNYQSLYQWKEYKAIFSLCNIFVMGRPGFELKPVKGSELEAALIGIPTINREELFRKRELGGIFFYEEGGRYDISSTKVRDFLLNGRLEEASELLNKTVFTFIQESLTGDHPIYSRAISND